MLIKNQSIKLNKKLNKNQKKKLNSTDNGSNSTNLITNSIVILKWEEEWHFSNNSRWLILNNR